MQIDQHISTSKKGCLFFNLESEIYLPIWLLHTFITDLKVSLMECLPGSSILIDDSCIANLKSSNPEVEYSEFSGIIRLICIQPDTMISLCENDSMTQSASWCTPSLNKMIDDTASDCSLNSMMINSTKDSINKPKRLGVNTTLKSNPETSKVQDGYYDPYQPSLGVRKSIASIVIHDSRIKIDAYNIKKSNVEKLFGKLIRIFVWNNLRIKYLKKFSFVSKLINLETLFVQPDILPTPSSYTGYLDSGKDDHFIKGELNSDELASRLSTIYSQKASTHQYAMLEFLIYFVCKFKDQIPRLNRVNDCSRFMLTKNLETFIKTPIDSITLNTDLNEVSLDIVDFGSDLVNVLRSVQVECAFKYPLSFTINEIKNLTNEYTFMNIVEEWAIQSAIYLESLHFQAISRESLLNMSPFNVHTIQTIGNTQYFVQNIKGGTLVVQIGIEGEYAFMNAYSIQFEQPEVLDKHAFLVEFNQTINRLKQKVHFHSSNLYLNTNIQ